MVGLLASGALLSIGRAFPRWVIVIIIPALALSFTTFVTGTSVESLSSGTTFIVVLPFRPVYLINFSSL